MTMYDMGRYLPFLEQWQSADMVIFSIFYLGMYLWLEATSLGATMIAPLVLKNETDKTAAVRALTPVFQANELWAAAGVWWLMTMFPSSVPAYDSALYIGGVLVLGGMVLRQWGAMGAAEGFLARVRRSLNVVLALGTVFFLCTAAFALLLNAGSGSVFGGALFWTPLGAFAGVWACLGFGACGALFLAWKSQNPLGERARATSLVIGALYIPVHVALLVTLYAVGNIPQELSLYFFATAVLTLVLYVAAFVAARRRKPGQAYVCAMLSGPVIAAMYLSWLHRLLGDISSAPLWGDVAPQIPAWFLLLPAAALLAGIAGTIARMRRVPEERQREYGWRKNG